MTSDSSSSCCGVRWTRGTSSRSATCSGVRALRGQPGERHRRHADGVDRRHVVEHVEEVHVARVVQVAARTATPPRGDVRPRPVLPREEPARERRIRHLHHAELTEGRQLVDLGVPRHQAVLVLRHGEPREPRGLGRGGRGAEPGRREVRRADLPHLAVPHEPVERGEDVLLRHVGVVAVGEVQVDPVRAEAAQRVLGGRGDVRRGEPAPRGEAEHLRRDQHVVAATAGLQPLADDRLGLAPRVAGSPGGVDVGGVDGPAAAVDERVEHAEALLAVGRPAEHVAAQHHRTEVECRHPEPLPIGRSAAEHQSVRLRSESSVTDPCTPICPPMCRRSSWEWQEGHRIPTVEARGRRRGCAGSRERAGAHGLWR